MILIFTIRRPYKYKKISPGIITGNLFFFAKQVLAPTINGTPSDKRLEGLHSGSELFKPSGIQSNREAMIL
jgi:hypothetical protein